MGLAGRKRKLSITKSTTDVREIAWRRYENVLTADVFGAYRYLPPKLGLLPILSYAVDETGQTFSSFLRRFGIDLFDLDIARIRFWPAFQDGSEPDVFVLLESTQHEQSVSLLVEAKLHAPQHDIGDRSQLGHYGIQHLRDLYADGSIKWELPPRPRPLLFITNHDETPGAELTRARGEMCEDSASLSRDEIGLFWVNWATVGEQAQRLWLEHKKEVEGAPWLRHLLDLYEEIRDRDLLPRRPFTGITRPTFSRPHFAYARSYLQPLPDSVGVVSIACRHYFRSPLERLPTDQTAYCRSYHSGQVRWNHFPAICSRKERTDE